MFRSITIYISTLLFSFNYAYSQSDVLMFNAKPYDTERYSKFNGRAYLWKNPMAITIHSTKSKPIKGIIGNYNLVEGEFEVYDGKKFIELNKLEYPKIECTNSDGIVTTLMAITHPKLKFGYCIVHYQDDNFRIFEQWKKLKSTSSVQTPGKTETVDKLKNSRDYYILAGGKLTPFVPKKKKIIKKFGHKKEIKAYIKSHDLKLKKMEDVITLFQYINEQGWLK